MVTWTFAMISRSGKLYLKLRMQHSAHICTFQSINILNMSHRYVNKLLSWYLRMYILCITEGSDSNTFKCEYMLNFMYLYMSCNLRFCTCICMCMSFWTHCLIVCVSGRICKFFISRQPFCHAETPHLSVFGSVFKF